MEDKKYRTIEVKPDWCVMCELLQMEQEYDRGEEPRSLTIDPLDFLPENLCAWHRAEAMRDAR